MARRVYKNMKVYIGGYDFSSDHTEASLKVSVEPKEVKNLLSEAVPRLFGLHDFEFSQSGYREVDGFSAIDDRMFDELGVSDVIASVCMNGGAAGETAYFITGGRAQYQWGASIGDAISMNGAIVGQGLRAVRGKVFIPASQTLEGAETGYSDAIQLGAVSSTQKLYACAHWITEAVTGPGASLELTVQSCATSDFGSGVTDRMTLNEWYVGDALFGTPVDGEITDTWWRVKYDTGPGLHSANAVAIVGIQ